MTHAFNRKLVFVAENYNLYRVSKFVGGEIVVLKWILEILWKQKCSI